MEEVLVDQQMVATVVDPLSASKLVVAAVLVVKIHVVVSLLLNHQLSHQVKSSQIQILSV
jgi:hypothetical protein